MRAITPIIYLIVLRDAVSPERRFHQFIGRGHRTRAVLFAFRVFAAPSRH